MQIWVRVGDGGEYEGFDDLNAVADHLAEFQAVAPIVRCNNYGITTPNHQGNNYISIFWGETAAEPSRKLTDKEIQRLQRSLDTHYDEE